MKKGMKKSNNCHFVFLTYILVCIVGVLYVILQNLYSTRKVVYRPPHIKEITLRYLSETEINKRSYNSLKKKLKQVKGELEKNKEIDIKKNSEDAYEGADKIYRDKEYNEEYYIKYETPKFLKDRNIDCPYKYGKVFVGTYGITNYELIGNRDNPLVIYFHGLGGDKDCFSKMDEYLLENNYQILKYDLYGHGLSECPKYSSNVYDLKFFMTQIEELVCYLNLQNKEFYLIGGSMGCLIAAAFAQKYINQVKKIVFLSPVGMLGRKPLSLKIKNGLLSIINSCSCVMSPFCFPKCCMKYFIPRNDYEVVYNILMWNAFAKKNLTDCIYGCLNNMPMWSSHDIFIEIGKKNIPTLIFCGEEDDLYDADVYKNLKTYFTNSHIIVFKGENHYIVPSRSSDIILCVAFFSTFRNDVDLKSDDIYFPVDQNGCST
ncbi:alpha/beta hydrolase, putative [Plasmodium sp. gorilla clade G3]|nr:alpha/beta hydrolase, putative [Plasmodium sp. gorilla clade G3]